ncbi:MAG: hypothetical protein KDI13_06385 [Alphaproteobacteria bacterium]|nr:hypothetical protein [Alphaproteobacteria bacterium]
MIKKLLCLLLLCITLTSAGQAFAAEEAPAPDSKEAFLAAWESHQKSLPTTVIFQKTDEPGVYDFETTLFPYKGKLRLMNILISKDIDYYDDYDLNDESDTKGVAEVELTGLPDKEFQEKYPYSNELWKNNQFLFFMKDADGGRWLSAKEWWTVKDNEAPPPKPASCGTLSKKQYQNLISVWSPVGVMIIVVLIVMLLTRKRQKAYLAKYDGSLAKQLEGIEIAKQGLALNEQQLELLRKIAENKQGS